MLVFSLNLNEGMEQTLFRNIENWKFIESVEVRVVHLTKKDN